MGGNTHRPYPEEFRWKAIELARSSDRSINQIAEELGISGQTLRNWVHQAEVDVGKRGGLTSDERDEFRAMKRENKRLKMERDILKKAAAFFAQESEGR